MKRMAAFVVSAGLGALALVSAATAPASAHDRRTRTVEQGPQLSEHPKSRHYRRQGPQVRGFVQRRGGYSYSYSDGVVEFRDRTILRDHQTWRSQGGPFDNGFFFDSGLHRQNDSPYLN